MPRKATSPARTPKVSSTRGVFWDEKEETKLTKLKSSGKQLTWAEIAEKLGTGRSAESVRQHWKLMQGAGTPKSSAKTPKTPKAPPPTPKTPAAAVAAGPSKALGVFMAAVLIAATAVATYAVFAPVD